MNPAIIPIFLIVNPNELLMLFRFVYIFLSENRLVRYRKRIALQAATRDLNKYTIATKNRRKRSRRQLYRLQSKMNVIENIVTQPSQHEHVNLQSVITPETVRHCQNMNERKDTDSISECSETQPVFDVVNETDEHGETHENIIDENTPTQLRRKLKNCGNDMVRTLVFTEFLFQSIFR